MASWVIITDVINGGEYDGEFSGNVEKCRFKFRLLDDDGILYFEGMSGNSSSFSPLDEFGSAFGCTELQYLESGKWETL